MNAALYACSVLAIGLAGWVWRRARRAEENAAGEDAARWRDLRGSDLGPLHRLPDQAADAVLLDGLRGVNAVV